MFAANSATAVITVVPTADQTAEANETVAITLVAGADDVVGTPAPVVATIFNDDIQSSTTAVLTEGQPSLRLTGKSFINGMGNGASRSLVSNSGPNILDGQHGVDFLTGGRGADTFLFSTKPIFGASTAHHITDYTATQGDKIKIKKAAFGLARKASASLATVKKLPRSMGACVRAVFLFMTQEMVAFTGIRTAQPLASGPVESLRLLIAELLLLLPISLCSDWTLNVNDNPLEMIHARYIGQILPWSVAVQRLWGAALQPGRHP